MLVCFFLPKLWINLAKTITGRLSVAVFVASFEAGWQLGLQVEEWRRMEGQWQEQSRTSQAKKNVQTAGINLAWGEPGPWLVCALVLLFHCDGIAIGSYKF